MPTAAQRAEAAAAAKAATAAAPTSTDGDDQGEVTDDLDAMTLTELRTEAKRLSGADYDHSLDQDREALTTMARALRLDRAAYYATQRQAQREAALAAMAQD